MATREAEAEGSLSPGELEASLGNIGKTCQNKQNKKRQKISEKFLVT